jgi:hypothetical protein
MTSDRAALREKVATICGGNYIAADAAIAVALEEAARMIETRWAHGTGDHQAAAIRGLITSPESAAPVADQPRAIR